jgi:4-diphosphocytidyl-2-C-methyl-D-erythritol kinase
MELSLPAYAKINLGLRVLGKRDDGYHEIETILQQVDFHDDLTFVLVPDDRIEVRCDSPAVPQGPGNLCWRAADLLRRTCGVAQGVRISLTKRIPVGAGLGGGSSDAAVTLLGLNLLWELGLSPERLEKLAAQLGSDVPFFILGGTRLATGRGEKLTRLDLPHSYWVLIVFPEIHLSTADVYENLRLGLTSGGKSFSFETFDLKTEEFCGRLQNDLEEVVLARYPSLAEIKKRLAEEGAFFTSMSGSGSAFFGLFEDEFRVQSAARSMSGDYPTFITRPIEWGFHNVVMERGEQL